MFTILMLYPGCIEFEVLLAAHLLGPKFPVRVATPDGKFYQSANGMRIEADFAYAEVKPVDVKVLLVPGGDPGSLLGNEDANRLVRQCHAHHAVIGAICAGPFVLAQAGILRGRRVAHGYQKEQLEFLTEFFAGVLVSEQPLEVDGTLITAKPELYAAFALELARKSGAVTDEKRLQRLAKLYRA